MSRGVLNRWYVSDITRAAEGVHSAPFKATIAKSRGYYVCVVRCACTGDKTAR